MKTGREIQKTGMRLIMFLLVGLYSGKWCIVTYSYQQCFNNTFSTTRTRLSLLQYINNHFLWSINLCSVNVLLDGARFLAQETCARNLSIWTRLKGIRPVKNLAPATPKVQGSFATFEGPGLIVTDLWKGRGYSKTESMGCLLGAAVECATARLSTCSLAQSIKFIISVAHCRLDFTKKTVEKIQAQC